MNASHAATGTERTRAGAAILIGIVLAVAACSSSGSGATTKPAASTPAPAATAGSQPTDAPAATQGSGGGGGGGGGSSTVCSLVTGQEMAMSLHLASLTTEALLGPPDTCGYRQDTTLVAAIVLTPVGGDIAYTALAGDSGAQTVTGIGDKAVYLEAQQLLGFMKGGKLVVLTLTLSDDQLPGVRVEVMKGIAAIAAGRV